MKLKLIAAAVALAATGQASAALQLGDFNNSSLAFVIWDTVKQVSYTRDLGTFLNDFLPNSVSIAPADAGAPSIATVGNKTPDSGFSLSFAADALYTATFGDSIASNLNWAVVADDNDGSVSSLNRIITTTVGTTGTITNGATAGASLAIRGLMLALNGPQSGCSLAASCLAANYTGTGSGASSFGRDINGQFKNGNSALVGFGSQNFFYYAGNNRSAGGVFASSQKVQFANASGAATWTLDPSGQLTYSVPSAVPLPAAAWLMGSGLVGLVGLGRRRIKAKALAA